MHNINKKKFFGAGCNSLPAVIVREPYKTVELVQFQYRQYSLDERRKIAFLLNFHEDTPYRGILFYVIGNYFVMFLLHKKCSAQEAHSRKGVTCRK